MEKIRKVSALERERKEANSSWIFVPTMGCLHEGHLSLFRKAKREKPKASLICSIFVNPLQFNSKNDFLSYPVQLKEDIKKCEQEGVDFLFLPEKEDFLSSNQSVAIRENTLSSQLCGKYRENHFSGVCTIILKFLNLIQPEVLVLGKKDYQQICVLRKMILDLNLNTEILSVETARDSEGLALSSRNIFLSEKEKKDASLIYSSLRKAKEKLLKKKGVEIGEILRGIKLEIGKFSSAKLEYAEIVNQKTLEPLSEINEDCLIAVAVWFGEVRLIDNIEVFKT